MKMNEIIRAKRKEQNLTQEQMAEYLGVSAPAVNKWEKGNGYPDILLLPPLARLLKVDLNTLLSFQDTMAQTEIELFMNDMAAMAGENYSKAFDMGMKKIEEFPQCSPLIFNTAMTLEGLMVMADIDGKEEYRNKIETLYQRVSNCEDRQICDQANYMLVGRYMERGEYEEAEFLLNRLPDKIFDKEYMRAELCRKQGHLTEAAKTFELKLGEAAMEIQSILYGLIDIAIEEGEMKTAEHFTQTARKTAETFDLWECTAWIARFQLAAAGRDADQCIEALKETLRAMSQPWHMADSPLYSHTDVNAEGYTFPQTMLRGFLSEIEGDEKLDFLKGNKSFDELMALYR